MMICIQCAMRAMLNGEPSPSFDETPTQHLRRLHPDPVATEIERREMERQLSDETFIFPNKGAKR
jgi:hypothetical protein